MVIKLEIKMTHTHTPEADLRSSEGGGTSFLREGVRVIDGRGSVPPRGVWGHA